jgi:hypothetical protein
MRIVLLVVGALAVAAGGTGCGRPPQPLVDALAQASSQARTSLSLHKAEPSKLLASDARRVVLACDVLRDLDPDRYARLCAGNPAVYQAIEFLKSNPEALTVAEKARLGNFERVFTSQNGVPAPPQARREDLLREIGDPASALAAVEGDIRNVTARFAEATAIGSAAIEMEAEARLRVLQRNLREAFAGAAPLLPSNPLALLDEDTLRTKLGYERLQEQKIRHAANLAPTANTSVLLQSLQGRIVDLENALAESRQFRIHLARDDLGEFDSKKYLKSNQSAEKDAQQELALIVNRASSQYPASERAMLAAALHYFPDVLHASPEYPRSSRIVEAELNYLWDPERWLVLRSALRAEYEELRQQTREKLAGSFDQWQAEALSPEDRGTLYALSAAVLRSGVLLKGMPAVPYHPESSTIEHFRRVVLATSFRTGKTEAEPAPTLVHYDGTDGPAASKELERLYLVREAEVRWGSPGRMPKNVFSRVNTEVAFSFASGISRLGDIAAQMKQVEDKAVESTDGLDKDQTDSFRQARLIADQAATRLQESVKHDLGLGYDLPAPGLQEMAVLLTTLGRRPPPDDDNGASIKASLTPKNPSGSGGAIIIADASFEKATTQAGYLLEPLTKVATALRIEPRLTNGDNGRWTVKETSLPMREFRPPPTQVDDKSPRLPENLSLWSGIFKKDGKTPYSYDSDVKTFTSFDPVGGGIHMGDSATLANDLGQTTLAIYYESPRQRLVAVSSHGERFEYGLISPDELKALYRFALSGQNLAISVGWSGDYRDSGASAEPVLLNPIFVDSRVGQQLFLADELPWKLDEYRLPNGKANPIQSAFKKAEDDFRSQLEARLLKAVKAAAEGAATTFTVQIPTGPVEELTSTQLAFIIAGAQNDEDVLSRVWKYFSPTTLAVLLDDPVTIDLQPGTLKLVGAVHYRYASSRFVADQQGIHMGARIPNGSQVWHLRRLSDIANGAIPALQAAYPPLANVAQYAKIVAFLRWAVKDPHVKRVDLSDLVGVKASDHERYRTPDSVVP